MSTLDVVAMVTKHYLGQQKEIHRRTNQIRCYIWKNQSKYVLQRVSE